jgi:Flp pilus assembly protein TadG
VPLLRRERGAAVVDVVLVMAVLVPMVLAVLQVSLVLLVRNTLTAAASDGARYAATVGRGPADGEARTREQIEGALASRFAQDVQARVVMVDGAPTVVVTVRATVPALGLGGPGVDLEVDGHAVQELQP